MIRKFLLILLFLAPALLPAQKAYHFIYGSYANAFKLNKKIFMAGYSVGKRRITFNICGAVAEGKDKHFLEPEQLSDNLAKQELSESQTVFPTASTSGMYLEEVNSTYSGKQIRMGITGWLRKNDTLGRHPFTGPHAGIEAIYMQTTENQYVVYKSMTTSTRVTYDGVHFFDAYGAATHLGWQFCFWRERIYLDLRAVVPFYYPMTEEPNLNSPYTGTKYEFQVNLSFHIGRAAPRKIKENGKDESAPLIK